MGGVARERSFEMPAMDGRRRELRLLIEWEHDRTTAPHLQEEQEETGAGQDAESDTDARGVPRGRTKGVIALDARRSTRPGRDEPARLRWRSTRERR